MNGFDVPGYEPLARALLAAYDQSARGKGKVRHANDRPFDQQPIRVIGRMVGPGYQTGQAMKKMQEAIGMLNRDEAKAAQAELLGAIVYAAAAWLDVEERYGETAEQEGSSFLGAGTPFKADALYTATDAVDAYNGKDVKARGAPAAK